MKIKESFKTKSFKNGTLSAAFILLAVAALVLVNVLVRSLPTKYTQIDVSGTLIYDIGEDTTTVVEALDSDVSIRVLAAESDVDERINTFLEKYAALSNHITVSYVDPVKNPTILETYEVASSCIVVESKATGKHQIIYMSDIVVSELDQYSYMYYGQTKYVEKEFAGEGKVTAAIMAVTNPNEHKAFTTAGHGESALPTKISELLKAANVVTEDVNLSMNGAVPADCELLIMNGLHNDLTDDECQMVRDYLAAGGKVMMVLAYDNQTYKNINNICNYYGINVEQGLLGDADPYYYYMSQGTKYYYDLYFNVNGDNAVATNLAKNYVFMENAVPMTKLTDVRSSVQITSLLHSSEHGFIYVDETSLDSITDNYNTYYMGLDATETVEKATAHLMVFSSSVMFEDKLLESFGDNVCNATLFVNTAVSDFDDTVVVNIPAKSLELSYNTASLKDSSYLINLIYGVVYAFIIPIVLFVSGLIVWLVRRRK